MASLEDLWLPVRVAQIPLESVVGLGQGQGPVDNCQVYLTYTTCRWYGHAMKQHPQIAALGTQIRSRRQALGLTQSRLAALTDLSRASINAFEAGTTDLGVAKVLKIAHVLDMSLSMKETKHVAPARRWLKAAVASGSVSYRNPLPESELVRAMKTGEVAPEFLPHVATLLEEASPTLLVRALNDVFPKGVPKAAWNNLVKLGKQTKVTRRHLRP